MSIEDDSAAWHHKDGFPVFEFYGDDFVRLSELEKVAQHQEELVKALEAAAQTIAKQAYRQSKGFGIDRLEAAATLEMSYAVLQMVKG